MKLGINHREIVEKYIEIDAYSQGNHKSLISNFSARNMGKNDLWITATASALNVKLFTTDKDFDHLNGIFLEVEYIEFETYKEAAKRH